MSLAIFWNKLKTIEFSTYYRNNDWHRVPSASFKEQVESFGMHLNKFCSPGEKRLAIFSKNRPEWMITGLGAMLSGVTVLGIDSGSSSEQIQRTFDCVNFDFLVIESRKQLESVPKSILEHIEQIIVLNEENFQNGESDKIKSFLEIVSSNDTEHFTPIDDGDCPAFVTFTSGTTGCAKGVLINQKQITLALNALSKKSLKNNVSQLRIMSWLPLSNLFQFVVDLHSLEQGGMIYYVRTPQKIVEFLPEVAPTHQVAVPRFFEKIYEKIGHAFKKLNLLTLGFINSDPIDCLKKSKFKAVYRMIVSNLILKRIFGRNISVLISGSAALREDVKEFFDLAGLRIRNAYGTSESVVPIAIMDSNSTLSSLGKPFALHEFALSDEGEALIRGECLSKYIVSNVVCDLDTDEDGYYHTGDFVKMNSMGELFFVGRKSSYFKTSTGRKVFPEVLEKELNKIPGSEHIVVAGEGDKSLVAIVDPAEEFRSKYTDEDLNDYFLNQFSNFENTLPKGQLPRRIILASAFSSETGELTKNLKLKRQKIIEKYLSHEASGKNEA